MNKTFRKTIPIIATSEKEYEAFVRYIQAKRDDRSHKFEFHISSDNKIKIFITEIIK